jgi:hypothetical protein
MYKNNEKEFSKNVCKKLFDSLPPSLIHWMSVSHNGSMILKDVIPKKIIIEKNKFHDDDDNNVNNEYTINLFGNFEFYPTLRILIGGRAVNFTWKSKNLIKIEYIRFHKPGLYEIYVIINNIRSSIFPIQIEQRNAYCESKLESKEKIFTQSLPFSKKDYSYPTKYYEIYHLLHWCCAQGDLFMTEYLLLNGKDPNCKDAYNATPLHWAIWSRNLNLIQLLISHNADVNNVDSFGITALHIAYYVDSPIIISVLKRFGASESKLDAKDKMPMEYYKDSYNF